MSQGHPSSDCPYKTCHNGVIFVHIANYYDKKRHYDVILWGSLQSTKSDHKLTSDLLCFFAGQVCVQTKLLVS